MEIKNKDEAKEIAKQELKNEVKSKIKKIILTNPYFLGACGVMLLFLMIFLFFTSCFSSVADTADKGFKPTNEKPIPINLLNINNNELIGLNDEGKQTNFINYNCLLIPNNVYKVSDNAFNDLENINQTFIDNIVYVDYDDNSTLTEIGENSFANLNNLQLCRFPSIFNSFGKSAFENDINLSVIDMASLSVIQYKDELFNNTPFNVSVDPKAIFALHKEGLANDYINADGWNKLNKDIFQEFTK